MKKGIAFDFDGVLADSLDRFLEHAEKVAATLGYSRSPSRQDLDALDQMKVVDFARQINLPEAVVYQFTQDVYDRIEDGQETIILFDGMQEVLEQAVSDFHVSIVTANREPVVEAFLKRYGLEDQIHGIYGGEDGWSKAEKLMAYARSVQIPMKHVFMVGDAVSDVRAAQEAGAKSIAVTWGGQTFGRLATALPDYILETPKALAVLLRSLAT